MTLRATQALFLLPPEGSEEATDAQVRGRTGEGASIFVILFARSSIALRTRCSPSDRGPVLASYFSHLVARTRRLSSSTAAHSSSTSPSCTSFLIFSFNCLSSCTIPSLLISASSSAFGHWPGCGGLTVSHRSLVSVASGTLAVTTLSRTRCAINAAASLGWTGGGESSTVLCSNKNDT